MLDVFKNMPKYSFDEACDLSYETWMVVQEDARQYEKVEQACCFHREKHTCPAKRFRKCETE